MRRGIPVGLRLGLWTGLALAVVLWILGTSIYSVLGASLSRAALARAQTAAAESVRSLGGNGQGEHMSLTDQGVQMFASRNDIALQVTDARGYIVQRSQNPALPVPRDVRRSVAGRIVWRGHRAAYVSVPVVSGGAVIGSVQAVASEAQTDAMLRTLRRLMIEGGIASLLLVAGLGYWLSRRALAPVHSLTELATKISQTDLRRRLEVGTRDEIGQLAQSFNDMLDRLEAAFERQSRFVSDASHELRTPLAVLSGYISLLDRWGGQDEKVRREAMTALAQETRRMQRLVKDLLFLAKGTQGLRPRLRYFDLGDLVAETVRECRAIPDGERVEDVGRSAAPVEADWELVKQLLWILLDNALKFTPGGGRVQVGAALDDRGAVLTVADEGVGMAPEVIRDAFERFYRGDPARKSGEGAGLGLAIAKEICALHGADIRMASTPGAGTTVEVRFPRVRGE